MADQTHEAAADVGVDPHAFAYRPTPIHKHIKNVLQEYPEGAQVLRELIQNADDARATKITFILDHRTHATSQLVNGNLARFQGPALLAFNDAQFSDTDVKSFQQPFDSEKAAQIDKIGRFGIGFMSVYHWTEVPMLVTGRHLIMLDPQRKYLAEGGLQIDFVTSNHERKCPDQFAAFQVLDDPIDFADAFCGTLFRFPLRTDADAAVSKIKTHIATTDTIRKAFAALELHATETLLFLKSLETIEVVEWHEDSEGPELVYAARIGNADAIRADRQRPAAAVRGIMALDVTDPVNVHYRAEIEHVHQDLPPTTTTWLIAHTIQPLAPAQAAMAEYRLNLVEAKMIPWGAVAVSLEAMRDDTTPAVGGLSCFLPLAEPSGLPVHVHGAFALASNRRSLAMPSDDLQGASCGKAMWNVYLFESVLASVYLDVLHAVGADHVRTESDLDAYYRQWPAPAHLAPNSPAAYIWAAMKPRVADMPLVYGLAGGNWAWVAGSRGHILDVADTAIDAVLRIALTTAPTLLIPRIPAALVDDLDLPKITPVITRRLLRELPTTTNWTAPLTRADKLALLEYLVADSPTVADLAGLPLVPLRDASFGVFGSGTTYYVPRSPLEEAILGAEFARFVVPADQLAQLTWAFLERTATANMGGLKTTEPEDVLALLAAAVPQLAPDGTGNLPVDAAMRARLKALFEYLDANSRSLAFLHGWHVVKAHGRDMLLPVDMDTPVLIVTARDAGNYTRQQLVDVLVTLECKVAEPWMVDATARLACRPYMVSLALPALLDSVSAARAELLVQEQRKILRNVVLGLDLHSVRPLSAAHKATLKRLPLFATTNVQTPALGPISNDVAAIVVAAELVPFGIDAMLKRVFIYVSSHAAAEIDLIQRILGESTIPAAKFWTNYIFPHIKTHTAALDHETIDRLVDLLFAHLGDLQRQMPSFTDQLATLPFVPAAMAPGDTANTFQQPSKLVDPGDAALVAIFRGMPVFPVGKYAAAPLRGHLQNLGLRTRLTRRDLVDRVKNVLARVASPRARTKATLEAIFDYLDTHFAVLTAATSGGGTDMSVADFKEFIRSHAKLVSTTGALVAGNNARPVADEPLVRGQMHLVAWHAKSSGMRALLGWDRAPAPEVLAARIGAMRSPLGNNDMRDLLKVYETLDGIAREDAGRVHQLLESVKWVNVGNRLYAEKHVARNVPLGIPEGHALGLDRYLAVLPAELPSRYPKLFPETVVQDQFATADIVRVLGSLAQEGKVVLGANGIKDAVRALTILAHMAAARFQVRAEVNAVLWVPTTANRLARADQVLFCDIGVQGDYERMRFPHRAHAALSASVARGVGLAMQSQLRMHSDDLDDLADVDQDNAGAFVTEQTAEIYGESRLDRLRNLLDDYTESAMLGEFLQNADDARACQFTVILDERPALPQDQLKSTLAPGLAPWFAGPCLWIYNDSIFSAKDWRGILRIGAGGKEGDLMSIGKFGYGFCAVYHFTDVPSVISGSRFQQFDPHESLFPGLRGYLRTQYVEKQHGTNFPDQFRACVGMLGFDPAMPFKGTLFRIPLRHSVDLKDASQISQVQYTADRMRRVVDAFKAEAKASLLFLKSVETVSVFRLDAHSRPLSKAAPCGDLLWEVAIADPKTTRDLRNNFVRHLDHTQGSGTVGTDGVGRTVAHLIRNSAVFPMTTRFFEDGRGTETRQWMVGTGFATPTSLQSLPRDMAAVYEKRKLISFGGVAVELTALQNSPTMPPGRLFCFLPLPIETQLPVHVHGSFALTTNRQALWVHPDQLDARARQLVKSTRDVSAEHQDRLVGKGKGYVAWNLFVLDKIIAPLHVLVMEHLVPWLVERGVAADALYRLLGDPAAPSLWWCRHYLFRVLDLARAAPLLATRSPQSALSAGLVRVLASGKEHVFVAIRNDVVVANRFDVGFQVVDVLHDTTIFPPAKVGAVVVLPSTLVHALDALNGSLPSSSAFLTQISPMFVRDVCRNANMTALFGAKGKDGFDARFPLVVKYMTEDGSVKDLNVLDGLAVVPLSDGSIAPFKAKATTGLPKLVIPPGWHDHEADLRTVFSSRFGTAFVHPAAGNACDWTSLARKCATAKTAANVKVLDKDAFAALLRDMLPRWSPGSLEARLAQGGLRDMAWLKLVWKFVDEWSVPVTLLQDLYLLPTRRGTMHAVRTKAEERVVWLGHLQMPETDVIQALGALHVTVLHSDMGSTVCSKAEFTDYLSFAVLLKRLASTQNRVANASATERHLIAILFMVLFKGHNANMSRSERSQVLSLPIWNVQSANSTNVTEQSALDIMTARLLPLSLSGYGRFPYLGHRSDLGTVVSTNTYPDYCDACAFFEAMGVRKFAIEQYLFDHVLASLPTTIPLPPMPASGTFQASAHATGPSPFARYLQFLTLCGQNTSAIEDSINYHPMLLNKNGERRRADSLMSLDNSTLEAIFQGRSDFPAPQAWAALPGSLRLLVNVKRELTGALAADAAAFVHEKHQVVIASNHAACPAECVDVVARAKTLFHAMPWDQIRHGRIKGCDFVPRSVLRTCSTPSRTPWTDFYHLFPAAPDAPDASTTRFLFKLEETLRTADFDLVWTAAPVFQAAVAPPTNFVSDRTRLDACLQHLEIVAATSQGHLTQPAALAGNSTDKAAIDAARRLYLRWLARIVAVIYTFLQDAAAQNTTDRARIATILCGKRVILNGATWVEADKLRFGLDAEDPVRNPTADAQRSFYPVAGDLVQFKPLFMALGADDLTLQLGAIRVTKTVAEMQTRLWDAMKGGLDVPESGTDVTFVLPATRDAKCTATAEVHAHRWLLMCATPHYQREFLEGEWAESTLLSTDCTACDKSRVCSASATVDLTKNKFSADSFRLFLYFLYHGHIPVICSTGSGAAASSSSSPFRVSPTAQLVGRLGALPEQDLLDHGLDLLELSDYHDVPDLKQRVEQFLVPFVKVDTVRAVHKHAEQHLADQLKAVCHEWMRKHADVLAAFECGVGSGDIDEVGEAAGPCR
ncbi:hypothetical protein AMAG_07941 [Allomyces macrogynus ATCC 38327]|uniref:BTB domain-containing protein n=1 Tax=Allomyces macrogynus (strain ATCC 38327) TaxID=578462 RepID=A0A0L0SK14_ALLM3|nr:hypothetical protein AMAG_07941 [Allomyces macrogynus ATCC 38327]|eukprot:KNE62755.1 hypothetical protein AMAG_07941 [Allomyces macrogynus ATCC 38327]